MRTSKIEELYQWTGEGLQRKQGEKSICIANFHPKVIKVYNTQEGRRVILELTFKSGKSIQIDISADTINRINWSKLDIQCIVYDDVKNASKYLNQLVCMQAAEYIESMDKITQYAKLGWNYNAYGNAVFVFGNGIIGGTGNDVISPDLEKYKLDFCLERQEELLKTFIHLLRSSPSEGRMLILYFFTGMIKSLYREANVPVDFAFFVFGEQQNRKTTLAKLSNNLYNRSEDMNFSLRTVQMLSEAMADKLISVFKDTTLILDDLAMTKDKQYQQKQEKIMEHVVRLLGNKARKSSNSGNSIKEYYPNANVIFTGEYLPCFPESTLSRMLIMEIKNPVDSSWLTKFGNEPLMLSTIAYSFISWIQKDYSKYVDIIKRNFEQYRENRKGKVTYQERISEHGFIMMCTSSLLYEFLGSKGYIKEAFEISSKNISEMHVLLEKQVKLMQETSLKDKKKDFCYTFAKLYMEGQLDIADVGAKKKEISCYDGFMLDKHTTCISTGQICEIMRMYYSDNIITVQAITKQLKANHFLITDNSSQPKSTKKVGNARYLHISKDVVKDYYKYCCH